MLTINCLACRFSCTTLELKKRQQRYNDSLAEIFLLSDQCVSRHASSDMMEFADTGYLAESFNSWLPTFSKVSVRSTKPPRQ